MVAGIVQQGTEKMGVVIQYTNWKDQPVESTLSFDLPLSRPDRRILNNLLDEFVRETRKSRKKPETWDEEEKFPDTKLIFFLYASGP